MRPGPGEGAAIGGFRVTVCAEPNDGLRIAEAERPDLIMLDVLMPGKSGLDVNVVTWGETPLPLEGQHHGRLWQPGGYSASSSSFSLEK